ncbi:hypothetical protein M422DRAFT_251052 [Sphaerobolus stellatus SS14]|uniref:Uncharacterized protein n=1 Tax=Sphaerobolus stellatus (strain SS14) TaxID=990650 RepID=A0A0C9USC0_SPHS4|nr:hypothetical protein M422DRAFT_251052 [Sphaerobolus stellatus SS14]
MSADTSADAEENSFDDLVKYMKKFDLYSLMPLFIGERKTATLFVFPPGCVLAELLQVPPKLRPNPTTLIVAIGFEKLQRPKNEQGIIETYDNSWKLSKAPDIHVAATLPVMHAIAQLRFPERLIKELKDTNCAIFDYDPDKSAPYEDLDTKALKTIFNAIPDCKTLDYRMADARCIFIHVGSWDYLHLLSTAGLIDRRRRNSVHFYTYGSSPTVEKKFWGVREVFPLGGVVTFTPRAIAQDPRGVEWLINKIDKHPWWTCYIIPPVVAMTLEVANDSKDKEANNTTDKEVSNNADKEAKKTWSAIDCLAMLVLSARKKQLDVLWQLPLLSGQQESLEGLLTLLDGKLAPNTETVDFVKKCQELLEGMEDSTEEGVFQAIVKDLAIWQSELRYEYRRFVIITDTSKPSNTALEHVTKFPKSKKEQMFEMEYARRFLFIDETDKA